MIVLDTHVLVWWTLDPARLSATARHLCDQIPTTGAKISTISLWEIGIKIQRGHLDLGLSLEAYVQRLRALKGLELVPVDVEHWLTNLNLSWAHRDPADRTIVATAQRHDLPLISKDDAIRAFYSKTVW
ncbi:MAG: type II toxin-antitoxin system VapC family toxin [Candidatus Competibacter denitrificans]